MEISPIIGFAEPFSSWSHLLAAALTPVGFYHLYKRGRGNAPRVFALALYSLSLLFLFSMSGVFHLLDNGSLSRDVLQRLDHAGIWMLIAGSFTPIHTILFRGPWRWGILSVVWVIAITGLVLEVVFFKSIPEWMVLSFYLGLGWIGLLSAWKFKKIFYDRDVFHLVAGGLAYSAGALFDFIRWPNLWHGVFGPHEVFHIFVICGATFHWLFIHSWANQPIRKRIQIDVSVFPDNSYLAEGVNEHLFERALSKTDLFEQIHRSIDLRCHPTLKPEIELTFHNRVLI